MRNNLFTGRFRGLAGRHSIRAALVLVVSLAILYHYAWRVAEWHEKFKTITKWHRYNLIMAWTPSWGLGLMKWYEPNAYRLTNSPHFIPELLDATWMGNYAPPQLEPPRCGDKTHEIARDSPLLLTMYILSTATGRGLSRDVIREFHPLKSIPPNFRHLVDVKFVLGRSSNPEEENALDEEQARFGDLVRLDNLVDGENGDKGKSRRWLMWAGRYGRPSQWILKCDDDSMPVMPNFMPWIARQDPSKPTYFGSGMRRDYHFRHYFCGLIYGFSWPLVQTIVNANLSDEVLDQAIYEDYSIGELMWTLPSKPGQPRRPDPDVQYNNMPPPNPDPRTGLVRLEVLDHMADEFAWWAQDWPNMYAYHGMKTPELYERRYRLMEDLFAGAGRKYEWDVPSSLWRYRNIC